MKITEILNNGEFLFSCEFFPPKTEEGMQQLFRSIEEFQYLKPGYISVTYGAGGGTRDKTIQIVSRVKRELGVEGMAHLTCVGHSKTELREILDNIKEEGIENVIALRGDPPKGEENFIAHPDGFSHANDLTQFIRQSYSFCIAVAGYPEGHVESPSKEMDWRYLEKKVKAGADFIVTQLFFNNEDFFAFEKEMRNRQIRVPIIPGIMPITNFNQIVRFTKVCGARIPLELLRNLEAVQHDAEKVERCGIDYATHQCEDLIDHGVKAVHFYTLNQSRSTKKIIENLKSKGKIK